MTQLVGITKVQTGICGLDQITGGGLPKGRSTLVCGQAGCGKSLLAMEFLVRGATEFGEPGVFVAFEETADELAQNVASLGFDVQHLVDQELLRIDCISLERNEIEEAGEYDLEGLFLRLGHAIDSIGAKRVVLDTIEVLFSTFSNTFILRTELRRLHRWLKEKGVSAIITGESRDGTHTRQGLEEYVSDCVIVLDHRLTNEFSTRTLRILKYRGTSHGTNEYPFLIDERGLSVMPITSLGLEYTVSHDRVASGFDGLDQMLGGGVFRGSSVLVSGTAGTGKTSIATYYATSCCRQGGRCIYFSLEEAPTQIQRNMRSIGMDLNPWLEQGRLRMLSSRPTLYGLESHLASMYRVIEQFRPTLVIVDPMTSFVNPGRARAVQSMLLRLVDFLKSNQVTAIFTALTPNHDGAGAIQEGISSIVDTALLLLLLEGNGEGNRGLRVLKSRGMAHSNQTREFLISDRGLELVDVVTYDTGFLTGAARMAQAAEERALALSRQQELETKRRELERRREALEAKIQALRAEFAAEHEDQLRSIQQFELREQAVQEARQDQRLARSGDVRPGGCQSTGPIEGGESWPTSP